MVRLRVSSVTDASGAWEAAKREDLVVIVDIIDMSTTLESALEAGAKAVFGAAPDGIDCPVRVSPFNMGKYVGQLSLKHNAEIIIAAEPRWAGAREREQKAACFIEGVTQLGAKVAKILPNAGAEISKLHPLKDRLVVVVSDTGGTAYDAAFNAGGNVTTATIARTANSKGLAPAYAGAERALRQAQEYKKNITVVAASANSWEDVMASHFICQLIQAKMEQEHLH